MTDTPSLSELAAECFALVGRISKEMKRDPLTEEIHMLLQRAGYAFECEAERLSRLSGNGGGDVKAPSSDCRGCGEAFRGIEVRYYTGRPVPFDGGPYHLKCLPKDTGEES